MQASACTVIYSKEKSIPEIIIERTHMQRKRETGALSLIISLVRIANNLPIWLKN